MKEGPPSLKDLSHQLKRARWCFFASTIFFTAATPASCGERLLSVERNCVTQWSLQSESVHPSPSLVKLDAIITGDEGRVLRLPGFWAGGREWRFRFSSSQVGDYSFKTICSDTRDKGLHGRTGSIRVVQYGGDNPLNKHGPVRLSPSGKYFEHADGKPFFWLADSWWHGMTTRLNWPGGFQTLTRDRKDKGFSVIQFAIAFPCDIEPLDHRGANEAGHAWTEDFESINPEYFELVDLRVEWLARQGMVPNIVGMWGYYLPFMGVDKVKQHWRYLVARYGAYPVTWTICGESTLTWYLLEDKAEQEARQLQKQGWSEVANYVATIDPFSRLRTVHPGPASGRLEPLADMSEIDIIMLQPGHRDSSIATALEHRLQAEKRYPDKPIMIGEACFEGMGGECKEKIQRILFWGSVLSGAPGHSYGVDAIWQFNTERQLFGKSPSGHVWGNTPWEVAYRWPGSKHVGIGREILEDFQWQRFEPQPAGISPRANPQHPREAFAAGIEDDVRMIYLPGGVAPWNRKYIAKELDPAVVYSATYIDPLTGKRYPSVDVKPDRGGNWRLPAAPILQDWVLVIEQGER